MSACRTDTGSLLVEAMFTLSIGSLLVALVCQVVLSLFSGQRSVYQRLDTTAMWNNAARVLREDVHAAITVQPVSGGMVVSEADGRVFHYQVNTNGQLVRTQVGGGTSVIAAGVDAISATVDPQAVNVSLRFKDDVQEKLYITFLPAAFVGGKP